jgi:oligopeptide/dipeptide ABC transporter ATP-binding protein
MEAQAQSDTYDPRVLVRVRGVTKHFPVRKWFFQKETFVKAVEDVSFDLCRGETLGIVGESGCGKSTLARTVLRLVEPTGGTVEYNGKNVLTMSKEELRSLRRYMQIVFQDPYSSLHPRMKIGDIVAEPLRISGTISNKAQRRERVLELMAMVSLDPSYTERYPHELSGGQQQRVAIARALATNPELLVCDEPVSALDVSVRAQILNLMEEIQKALNLTYLFISHDLSVIEHICDRVLIMYLGHVMELGITEEVFGDPLHPYTQALLSAIPEIDKAQKRERILLEGEIPSPIAPPDGCRFHTRCRFADEICRTKPSFRDVGGGHYVACHRVTESPI